MLLGRPGLRDIAHDFPATQPTSAPREPSLWVRASLLTQAKFFRHERSCRSPRGDTQPLRLLIILVRTFDPPGHCYAWVRGQCISRFIDASLVAVSALLRGSLAARHLFLGQHARSGACGPQGRVLLPRLGAWRSTPLLPSQRIRAWRSGRAIRSCPSGVRSKFHGRN